MVEYRVLGPLEVVGERGALPLGGYRQRLLLAVLLSRVNQVLDIAWLVDAVWGDHPPRTARKTLQVYLARLRQAIGEDAITTTQAGYRLDAGPESLDSQTFERLADEGRGLLDHDPVGASRTLREALALWRGPPFGELGDVGVLKPESTRLQQARLAALEDRIEAELACGRGGELVPELTDLVATHPMRERLRAQLMNALYRAGRQADALMSFEQARIMLAEELGTDPSEALSLMHERILQHDPTLEAAPSAAVAAVDEDLRNPYKGLRAFTESDASDFFGRDDLVEMLVTAVASHTLVAVVGPSGSGKSSAVRAGLVPRLKGSSPAWRVVSMTPGRHPFENLQQAVHACDTGVVEWQADRLDLLRTLQSLHPADGAGVLLVIDQFEELVTQTSTAAERERFVANLIEVVEDPECGIVVLLTVRADFFEHVLGTPTLGELCLAGLVGVLPMSPGQIEAAAAEPAARVGLGMEPELVAELVADMTDQPGALPLFQYALTETFERRTGPELTRRAYVSVGGLRGALARRAEETYQTLGEDERAATRQVFLRMVAIGQAGQATRRRVPRGELESLGLSADALAVALDSFDRARLLTFDWDPVAGDSTVELAHEALITHWPRLGDWVASVRDDLRLQQRLAVAAAEWQATRRDADYLITGSRLGEFAEWPAPGSVTPSALEREFLAHSREEDDRRSRQRRLAARRLRVLVAAMTAVAVIASVLFVAATQRGRQIEAASQAAQARDLAAAAVATVGTDSDLSLLLGLASHSLAEASGDATVEATSALHHVLVANRLLQRFADSTDVAFLPDGRLVVAGKRTAVVDLSDPGDVLELEGGAGACSVDASQDGRWIGAGSFSGRVVVWDARTGQQVERVPVSASDLADVGDGEGTDDDDPCVAVAFDPAGDRLASLRASGRGLDVWSLATGENEARQFFVEPGDRSIAFVPDGNRVVMTTRSGVDGLSLDGTWEQAVASPGVLDVVALPSGMATVGGDGVVRLWDDSDRAGGTLSSDSAVLTSVAATSDGSMLAAGSSDGVVHMWTRTGGDLRPYLSFSPTSQALAKLALDATGRHVAGVDATGIAYVWDVADKLPGEDGSWPGGGPLAVSPDGRQVAVVDLSGERATVRGLPDGDAVATLEVPNDKHGRRVPIVGLAYHPDGTAIIGATGGAPAVERVLIQTWDAASGRPEQSTTGDVATYGPVAVSADGSQYAVASCLGLPVGGQSASPAWIVTQGRIITLATTACGRAVDLDSTGSLLAVQTEGGSVHVRDIGSFSGQGWLAPPTPLVVSLQHQPATTGSVAFSPDDSMLLTAGVDGTARVWDLPSGESRLVLDAGGGPVERALWTPDGLHIVTSSHDGVPRIWDVQTGRLEAELPAHGTWPYLAVTPDGRRLLTSADGVVRSWIVDSAELVEAAHARLTRGLTDAECERYGISPCRTAGDR